MIDSRKAIQEQLVLLLSPIGIPVYSFVPSNEPNPFIYIGDMENEQLIDKTNFRTMGTVNVELFTGTKQWKGSLEQPYEYLSQIKELLQPTIKFKLDLTASRLSMAYWRLFNDTGLFDYTIDQRNYTAIMQYEFEVTQLEEVFIYNVIFGLDNVVYNGDNVIYTN